MSEDKTHTGTNLYAHDSLQSGHSVDQSWGKVLQFVNGSTMPNILCHAHIVYDARKVSS